MAESNYEGIYYNDVSIASNFEERRLPRTQSEPQTSGGQKNGKYYILFSTNFISYHILEDTGDSKKLKKKVLSAATVMLLMAVIAVIVPIAIHFAEYKPIEKVRTLHTPFVCLIIISHLFNFK